MNEQPSVLARGARIVAAFVRAHPRPFAISVAGATLYAGMTVLTAVVLGWVTNKVLEPAFKGGVSVGVVLAAVAAILGVGGLPAAGGIPRRDLAGRTGGHVRP